ncbi:hypothetical protein [Sorangium sp. So ce1335]|uniref:hypothetical protein n=1 Tax=Sorangium sp. So ce1335 TaxID=3133335 RepID=UPI003F63DC3E
MKTKTMLAFVGLTGQCAIAVLGLGCAQIFGFDKTYESAGGSSEGGGGGTPAGSGGGDAAQGSGTASAGSGTASAGSGTTSSGSAGGGGADPCAVLEVMPGESLGLSMIDDMEDEDLAILPGDGVTPREGYWFKDNDGSEGGVHEPENEVDLMTPLDLPRGDSRVALHTSANNGFVDYGASVALFLYNDDFGDASEYRGITFWARAEEGSSRRLKVTLIDKQTRPTGGICDEAAGECYDHFYRSVTLTDDWKHFKVPAECLEQAGFGKQFDALLLDQLWGVYFSFDKGQAFDLWIDDVAFYR